MEFIIGADASIVKEVEQLGAVYKLDGKEEDVFKILSDCGMNLIRLRVWNNPYDDNGNPFGGGTNDIKTTIELAKRIKQNGMKFMLDFHYSDFWADPKKQMKPRMWENLSGEDLVNVVYSYTVCIMEELKNSDVLPDSVEVGNEITNGFLWPDGKSDSPKMMAKLLQAGIDGVHRVAPDAKIMIHLDFGTDKALYRRWFDEINKYNIQYDIIGMSYYPYWNGSMKDLIDNMKDVSQRYDKDVMVAETSIGYTTDTLGCDGIVFNDEMAEKTDYSATPEGQKEFMSDLIKGTKSLDNGHGIGVLYWEPAWLPIAECTWATEKGCKYMGETATGGNSWGNQALFDSSGNALPALTHLKEM